MVDKWESFFFQAEDGMRDARESRGLGDVYEGRVLWCVVVCCGVLWCVLCVLCVVCCVCCVLCCVLCVLCVFLYISYAADEEDSVEIGVRRVVYSDTHHHVYECSLAVLLLTL